MTSMSNWVSSTYTYIYYSNGTQWYDASSPCVLIPDVVLLIYEVGRKAQPLQETQLMSYVNRPPCYRKFGLDIVSCVSK